jgi:cell wall-associated NlpC family hydrolase
VLLNKKIISLVLALGIVVSTTVPVLADPSESQLNSQLKEQQSELNQDKKDLQQLRNKREDVESAIELIDGEIEEFLDNIKDIKKKIEQTLLAIKAAEEEIKTAEENMEEEKELFNQRMRAIYISGFDSYLSILLDSEGFSDFLTRVEVVKRIADADKKIMEQLAVKKEEVAKKKEALDNQRTSLITLKSDSEAKLAKINEKKEEQAKLIVELRAKEKEFAAEIAEEQKKINETMKLINAIRSKIPKYTPSRGAASYSSDAAVAYAANFLGTRYVWGGTSPLPGFDCSGFMQYVYRHFGISLPRVSASQATVGTPVNRSDLQPGDLVFFKKPGRAIHHVGMYVGNNSFIHAPQSGDVVKISILNRSDYYTARRVR